MSKMMKRMLSMLAVLALVLTMAPAGILAVETKAAADDANLPEGVAALMATEQAKQVAAVAALKQLTGTTMEDRRKELKTILPTCPFCNETVSQWLAVEAGTQYGGVGVHQHFYAYGEIAKTGALAWYMSRDNSKACILLDEGAVVTAQGRIQLGLSGNEVNVGGLGTFRSTMILPAATDTANQWGMFNLGGGNTKLNLYGGTFINDCSTTLLSGYTGFNRSLIRANTSTAVVNVWTDDVYIGPAEAGTTPKLNFRMQAGSTLNIYGGNIRNACTTTGWGQGWNVFVQDASTVNMYGGTISGGNGTTKGLGASVHLYNTGTFNMYGGTVSGGKALNGGNIYVNTGATANIQGGTISGGEAEKGGNIYVNAGTLKIAGAIISNGEATADGGNIYITGGTATLEATNTISGGIATGNGGNIHVQDGAALTVKCDLIDGHAGYGGNLSVATATTNVILDGATLSGGTLENGTTLQNNARVPKGTLTLKNGAKCSGGVLLWDDAESVLNVDSSFTGDFYLWQNGAAATPGTAVRNATCNGAFTGLIRNGNWLYAAATDDRAAVYIPVAMQWDGTTGLKYAAQGVVYNGVLTPAASGQAAVDAYVAAMANEEIEGKPQYVYVTEDVELKDGAEVAIWPGADITVSGKGVVAGVARKNDNYAEQGAAITVSGDVTVAKEVTVGSRRYIALTGGDNGNKYTFHRVEIELTNVTVNVDKAGIYYKAQYKFDEVVKGRVDSYGVLLNLNEAPTEESLATSSSELGGYADATLVAASHGVYGIFKDGKESNLADGKTKVFGNPYLAINTTGEELEEYPMFTAAEAIGKSLADSMELANEKWDQLSADGQTALNEFVNKWNALGAWETDLIAKLTNFTIA